MPSVEQLKQRLAKSLKAKKIVKALAALELLAREEPDEPSWPRRAAPLRRATSDFAGELAAHRRALELQVDRGLVLDAIASCTAILEIVPDDKQTLESLDLLYMNQSPAIEESPAAQMNVFETPDAPLDSRLRQFIAFGQDEDIRHAANFERLDQLHVRRVRVAADIEDDDHQPQVSRLI